MNASQSRDIYAQPREVTDLSECRFYHTMEIPGHGVVEGQWDLRKGIREYTGGLDFKGKRVLEVGTASGFVCFYMEREGADVVAYDLSDQDSWDIVPMRSIDLGREDRVRRASLREINNGYWFAHRALGSKARVVYGRAYAIPKAIGDVDISIFCTVLLHLRDPFLALWNAARLTRSTMLVTESEGIDLDANPARSEGEDLQLMQFIPNFRTGKPLDSWWYLSPQAIVAFLGVLGFGDCTVTRHSQASYEGERKLFTVVARRTAEESRNG